MGYQFLYGLFPCLRGFRRHFILQNILQRGHQRIHRHRILCVRYTKVFMLPRQSRCEFMKGLRTRGELQDHRQDRHKHFPLHIHVFLKQGTQVRVLLKKVVIKLCGQFRFARKNTNIALLDQLCLCVFHMPVGPDLFP